ncbi:unnamed protein product [Brassicogethes aeneus]|uniref:Uncharacterized protein n=1 Tax=Brassicogethes aeneus TaxID=1431903 RepID=A0A9P0FGT7_BRAAE|nr:unnamed protein product [Brassicogethes aeneus]
MSTDIENTIKELENEIHDLVIIGEGGTPQQVRFTGCNDSKKCKRPKSSSSVNSGININKATLTINLSDHKTKYITKNASTSKPRINFRSFSRDPPKALGNGMIEKSRSCPCSGTRSFTHGIFSGTVNNKTSRKNQSVYMSNKSSFVDTPKKKFQASTSRPKLRSHTTRVTSKNESDRSLNFPKFIPPPNLMVDSQDELDKLKHEILKVKSQLTLIKNSNTLMARKTIEDLTNDMLKLRNENAELKGTISSKQVEYNTVVKDLKKVKDMLSIYEEKVGLLHEKALVSSKVMTESKDKFCKCLQEREKRIKKLSESMKVLKNELKEKDEIFEALNNKLQTLEKTYESSAELSTLKEANSIYSQCICELENKLKKTNEECEKMKTKACKYNARVIELEKSLKEKCDCSSKFEPELLRLQENETHLKEEINYLTKRINSIESEKLESDITTECEYNSLKKEYEHLQGKHKELLSKYKDYEDCAKKCDQLEMKYQCISTELYEKESKFLCERNDLRDLVDQLTSVVEQNKHTLMHLSVVNKEQETMLKTQSETLEIKDKKIQEVVSEYEMVKKKSEELEREVEQLMKTLSTNDDMTCSDMRQRVLDLMSKVDKDKISLENKSKMIEEQSKTITNLQDKIREHTREIRKSKEIANVSVAEVYDLKEELKKKQYVMDKEARDKEILIVKLRKLEMHKNKLNNDVSEMEKWVKESHARIATTKIEKTQLDELQNQVDDLKIEWQREKRMLCQEKEQANLAAQFATKRLMDTVKDFQNQMGQQKQYQTMLSSMLQQKEKQLRVISSQMSSFNTYYGYPEQPLQQIYKCNVESCSTPNTPSTYSTCYEPTPTSSSQTKRSRSCKKHRKV